MIRPTAESRTEDVVGVLRFCTASTLSPVHSAEEESIFYNLKLAPKINLKRISDPFNTLLSPFHVHFGLRKRTAMGFDGMHVAHYERPRHSLPAQPIRLPASHYFLVLFGTAPAGKPRIVS